LIALGVFKHLHTLDLSFHLNRRIGGITRDIDRGTQSVSTLLSIFVFNICKTFGCNPLPTTHGFVITIDLKIFAIKILDRFIVNQTVYRIGICSFSIYNVALRVKGQFCLFSCFTLVSISLERYFGICRPLRSRRWQTLSHAYKVILFCWIVAAIVMIPIAICTKYGPLRNGGYKCDEVWETPGLFLCSL
jgi:hypothetical protein